jgi:hypothetical protein
VQTTADPNDIADHLSFCRAGRIYEIASRIMTGKPLQATHSNVPRKRFKSPMEIAIGRDL